MILSRLSIVNFKNIAQADLSFSPNINCFLGNNGMGKSNLLDAIYYLSFCKSYTRNPDSQNIRHGEDFFVVQGYYERNGNEEELYCGIKRRQKKAFKRNKKEYDRLFGDVPWIDKQQTASDDLQVSRTSKDIVYQHIIDDFSDAASMLPAVYENTTDIGRATKGAAFGLLAKVYLTLKRYNETLVAIDSVTNLGVYSLNRKYEWNFSDLRENGPESLFEVQYEKDVTAYSEFDILGQGGWHHEYMAPLASINIGGPWGNFGWFAVYPEFVESYEPGDLRKSVSVWCEGDVYQGWSYDPTCSQTGHNVKKFLCENIGVDRAMDSPLNFPVLRFADVLLMQAEALNELGRSSEAAAPASSENDGGPLNRVRVRAGLPNVTTTDQVELREIIRHERRMELAFEGGHRWFDLVRYDNDGEYAKTFFQSIGKTNFTTPKHLLLPVPIDDIDANPNLLPNNQGY